MTGHKLNNASNFDRGAHNDVFAGLTAARMSTGGDFHCHVRSTDMGGRNAHGSRGGFVRHTAKVTLDALPRCG
jgi:hypothetical protein